MATCQHVAEICDVTPSAQGCEVCLKTGDSWVQLRECLICGHVGCCDSSKNKHATEHFHDINHPRHAVLRAGTALDVVLRGQHDGRAGVATSPNPHFVAPAVSVSVAINWPCSYAVTAPAWPFTGSMV